MPDPEASSEVVILDHLPEEHVDAALGILFDAFSNKFRHGLNNADDFVRLFRHDVRRQHCYTAFVDGRLMGIVTISTGKPNPREFYHVSDRRLFTTFNPYRTLRILFNLFLLNESLPADEFQVESIAVSGDARGLGIGGKLMQAAEDQARGEGYPLLVLGVLGINTGAVRLYERLGYRITKTTRGFWVWLATASDDVHRMEKPLT